MNKETKLKQLLSEMLKDKKAKSWRFDYGKNSDDRHFFVLNKSDDVGNKKVIIFVRDNETVIQDLETAVEIPKYKINPLCEGLDTCTLKPIKLTAKERKDMYSKIIHPLTELDFKEIENVTQMIVNYLNG